MRIIVLIIGLTISRVAFACDACAITSGLINSDPVNNISLSSKFLTREGTTSLPLKHSGSHSKTGTLEEFYYTGIFSAKYFVHPMVYIGANVGYKSNVVGGSLYDFQENGLYDPQLNLGLQQLKVINEDWLYSYNIGLGADLPLGKRSAQNGVEYSPATNTLDVNGLAELFVKFKKISLYTQNMFIYNGLHKGAGYQEGSLFNSLNRLYYHLKKFENGQLIPFIGVSYEWDGVDVENGAEVWDTRSQYVNPLFGVNVVMKDLILSADYRYGIALDHPGWATVSAQNVVVGLTYRFGEK